MPKNGFGNELEILSLGVYKDCQKIRAYTRDDGTEVKGYYHAR